MRNCKYIYILITIMITLLYNNFADAKPFLEITRIDAKKNFPQIELNLSVKGNDKTWLKDLNEENILIYEDGYRVNYVKVMNNNRQDEVFYLVFSVDSSKSISEKSLQQIKLSASNIITASTNNQKIALYRFNDEVMMLNTFTKNFSNLLDNIKQIKRHGSKTLLYNSIYDSIDLLSRVESRHKAIIIFTDGKDEGSSVTSEDVIKFSKENNIPLYFMCLKSSQNKKLLSRISKLTGGKLVYGNKPDSVVNMYNSLVSMIKNQYSVQYYSMLKKDGKKHTIEVRLKYGNIRDRDKQVIIIPGTLLSDFKFPSLTESLLIILVFLLFVFLIIFIFYIVRRSKKIIQKTKIAENTEPSDYVNLFDLKKQFVNMPAQMPPPAQEEEIEDIYSRAWLVQKEGPNSGKKFPLQWDEYTIGRSSENSLVIEDNSVSLRHAKIKKESKGYILFDMASDAGTFLNQRKLLRPKILYDWDEVQIGKICFIFRGSKIG